MKKILGDDPPHRQPNSPSRINNLTGKTYSNSLPRQKLRTSNFGRHTHHPSHYCGRSICIIEITKSRRPSPDSLKKADLSAICATRLAIRFNLYLMTGVCPSQFKRGSTILLLKYKITNALILQLKHRLVESTCL